MIHLIHSIPINYKTNRQTHVFSLNWCRQTWHAWCIVRNSWHAIWISLDHTNYGFLSWSPTYVVLFSKIKSVFILLIAYLPFYLYLNHRRMSFSFYPNTFFNRKFRFLLGLQIHFASIESIKRFNTLLPQIPISSH